MNAKFWHIRLIVPSFNLSLEHFCSHFPLNFVLFIVVVCFISLLIEIPPVSMYTATEHWLSAKAKGRINTFTALLETFIPLFIVSNKKACCIHTHTHTHSDTSKEQAKMCWNFQIERHSTIWYANNGERKTSTVNGSNEPYIL